MSLATWRDEVSDLVVRGVARRYLSKPGDIERGDLPAMWVQGYRQTGGVVTYGRQLVKPQRSVEIVIAVRPIIMGSADEQLDDLDDIAAALETAINAGFTTVDVIERQVEYSHDIEVAGIQYAGVLATVTGID